MQPDQQLIEIDFSDLESRNSGLVNAFYDELDALVEASGQRWFFLVNYRQCTVWPEAWVAYAHRGKKISVSYALGTARYAEEAGASEAVDTTAAQSSATTTFTSRQAALAYLLRTPGASND